MMGKCVKLNGKDAVAPVEAHRSTRSGDKRIQTLIQKFDNVSAAKDIPYQTVMKELKQLQQAFIRQHEEYWWDGGKGKVWNQSKVALLKSAGASVNFVAQDSAALAPWAMTHLFLESTRDCFTAANAKCSSRATRRLTSTRASVTPNLILCHH